jgi:mono/diheme cytochrome c family protein
MMTLEIKATLLGLMAALGVFGLVFVPLPGTATEAGPKPDQETNTAAATASSALPADAKRGRELFGRNCAHCHGDDARGDEGPDLYDLKLSDARIAKKIRDGIKGEMPKFRSKLDGTDVQNLLAFLRSLKS